MSEKYKGRLVMPILPEKEKSRDGKTSIWVDSQTKERLFEAAKQANTPSILFASKLLDFALDNLVLLEFDEYTKEVTHV